MITNEDSTSPSYGGENVTFGKTHLRYRFFLSEWPIVSNPERQVKAVIEHDPDSLIFEVTLVGDGYGKQSIHANDEVIIEISYALGDQDTVPELEILDELERTALDAVLIIFEAPNPANWSRHEYMRDGNLPEGSTELMRIDLREFKN